MITFESPQEAKSLLSALQQKNVIGINHITTQEYKF